MKENPLRLVRRGGHFYIHGTIERRLIRVTTGTGDLVKARNMLENMLIEHCGGWRLDLNSNDVSWMDVARWMCQRQRTSAKERGICFELVTADVYKEMERLNFRCAVSGISMSRRVGPIASPDPWAASIDRIDNRHGYTPDNFRVVCLVANLAMNRWGYDVLLRLSKSVTQSANLLSDENYRLVGTKLEIVK